MKTNFLQKNNSYALRGKKKRSLLVSVAILFLLCVLFRSTLKNLLFTVGKPFWNVRNNVASFVTNNMEVLRSKRSLIDENNAFAEEINRNEEERSLTDLIRKENEELKSILNRGGSRYNKILSAVLIKPFLSPYDTLVIDVGVQNGVSVGDKVLALGYSFIGYVKEVYEDSSKVVLYSSYGEKVKVLVGSNNISKEALGIGGGNFKIEIPKEVDIKEGDPIVIPSISYNIFAIVEKVEAKENDSFSTVLFKSIVNMSELKWVEIILSAKK